MSNDVCPRCGNNIPEWSHGVCYTCVRIENDHRRYGRRRPDTWSPPQWVAATPGPTRRRKRLRRPAKVTTPAGPPQFPIQSGAVWTVDEVRVVRQGINRFLSDCYGGRRFLSHILRADGLTSGQIRNLQDRHLTTYITHVVAGWCRSLAQTLPVDEYQLLVRVYGLDGAPPLSMAQFSATEEWSMTACLRLWQTAIGRLRRAGLEMLEQIAVTTARALLD